MQITAEYEISVVQHCWLDLANIGLVFLSARLGVVPVISAKVDLLTNKILIMLSLSW